MKKLEEDLQILENYSKNIFDETSRISKLIIEKYEKKNNHN